MNNPYEVINGMAQIPIAEYEALLSKLEDMDDEAALEHALQNIEEFYPLELTEKILNGTNPVRVFREYRDLTQEALAKKAGIGKSMVSRIENGGVTGSLATMKAIAATLSVDLDEIV